MSEPESRLMPGGKRGGNDTKPVNAGRQAPPPRTEAERFSMAVRVKSVEARLAEMAQAQVEIPPVEIRHGSTESRPTSTAILRGRALNPAE